MDASIWFPIASPAKILILPPTSLEFPSGTISIGTPLVSPTPRVILIGPLASQFGGRSSTWKSIVVGVLPVFVTIALGRPPSGETTHDPERPMEKLYSGETLSGTVISISPRESPSLTLMCNSTVLLGVAVSGGVTLNASVVEEPGSTSGRSGNSSIAHPFCPEI